MPERPVRLLLQPGCILPVADEHLCAANYPVAIQLHRGPQIFQSRRYATEERTSNGTRAGTIETQRLQRYQQVEFSRSEHDLYGCPALRAGHLSGLSNRRVRRATSCVRE